MTTEHQPGSTVDIDELERDGHEWDHGQLLRAARSLCAELRTLRARVGELEKLRCLSCGCEILFDGPPESAEELRGTNLYCEMCETPIEADEHRHQLETFREELASLRTRAESAEARVTALEARRFPIMNGPSIPWEMIAPYENQAQKNHSQSLERLAERGGLDPSEALAVLESRRWHTMDPAFALASLAEAVLRWKDRPLQARITALESQLAAARSNSAQLSEELRAVGEELAAVREEQAGIAELFAAVGCPVGPGPTSKRESLAHIGSELLRHREESNLEAKVREVLGERADALRVHFSSLVWKAEWRGLDTHGRYKAHRAHGATLPALLRAILAVEKGGPDEG